MSAVRPSSRWRFAVAAFAVALLASACSSNDDSSVAIGDAAPSEATTTSIDGGEVEAADESAQPDGDSDEAAEESGAEGAESEPLADQDPLFFGEFASLAGESVDLADYAGQDVVLWFWAPW